MKKRLLAAALAVCLALALLPAYALAAGRPASTDYWIDMTTEEARQTLRAAADGSESRYIVFVYYGTASLTAAQQFSDYANKNKCRIYNYAYTGGTGGESLADELAPLFGGAAPTALPAAVTFNPSTKTCLAKENVKTLLASPAAPDINGLLDLMRENGVSSGSTLGPTPGGPDIPPVDPDDPDDPPAGPGSGSSIPNVHEYAWEVLRLVNQHRMDMGLQPLSVFDELQQAANIRAGELYDDCSHTRPDGRDYSTVYTDLNIPATSWAENIASGQKNAADVMRSWLNSPGHRANIEKASGRAHLGVGYYYNAERPHLHPSNWSQNFVSCYDCGFSSLRLSEASVAGRQGADLEDLLTAANIEVTAICYRHGLCSLPLIAAMCSGYDANDTGDQTLTVTYGGQTASLTVTGAHTHTWDNVETTAPSCTVPGSITYACTACGMMKTDATPATGHRFGAAEEDGMYACMNDGCETAVPAELAAAYPELKDGFPGFDMAAASVIEAYLKECAENTLQDCGNSYGCDILNGRWIENDTAYEFSVGIRQILTRALDYILITEPLTIPLNPPAIGDAESDAYPAVTPDEEQPITPPVNSLLPPPAASVPLAEASSTSTPETAGGDSSNVPSAALNPAPMPFADVSSGHWFYDSVDYVWKHYLMSGVSDTRFAPDETTSRAMIWTILARMHGVSTDTPPVAAWYAPGMQWAMQQGLSDGTNPTDGITREQLAAMLWRDAGSPSAGTDLSGFDDSGSVSGYALDAMRWAVASGIMRGAGSMLQPKNTATRAEAAVMIARYAGRPE
ncbi:MAG: hypothetical protein HDT18_08270 [Oscillibacter sp.]|nr:hypothetical protein [Oscillibacter sp.]